MSARPRRRRRRSGSCWCRRGNPRSVTPAAAARLRKAASRRRVNVVALALSLAAMAFGIFWLVWILVETVHLGIGGLSLSLFTEMTPPPMAEDGGLANAIFGSLTMVGLATCIGTPIGVMAGVYLAEYGQKSRLGSVTRFINDILLAAPSIVIGLFIYTVVVAPMNGFSGWAGVLALALLVIPDRDPDDRKHALADPAFAARSGLRARHAEVARHHDDHAEVGIGPASSPACCWRSRESPARPRRCFFTALSNQFWSASLSQPMASLPVTIFKFAISPYENWQKLAWAGVFLITLGVLGAEHPGPRPRAHAGLNEERDMDTRVGQDAHRGRHGQAQAL